MKRYIKNFMMAMMVGATVFGSSCTDSFEEVNTDPDSPTDVPTTNLLAYSLYYTSYLRICFEDDLYRRVPL